MASIATCVGAFAYLGHGRHTTNGVPAGGSPTDAPIRPRFGPKDAPKTRRATQRQTQRLPSVMDIDKPMMAATLMGGPYDGLRVLLDHDWAWAIMPLPAPFTDRLAHYRRVANVDRDGFAIGVFVDTAQIAID